MSDHDDLASKIAQAKDQLPLPELFAKLGLSDHAKKRARCPFPGHEDKHPSFSVFKGTDGFWHWQCFAGCGDGDEIAFLSKWKGIPLSEAISLYLEMAGFPRSRPPVSREYPLSRCVSASPALPECPVFPESPCVSVSPVSEGQATEGNREKALRLLAAGNACSARKTAKERRFKLLRDLKALEREVGRKLDIMELMIVFDEWYRLSLPSLDPKKTHDDYLAAFLAELGKVRVPTGEGVLSRALQAVAKLAPSELPMIPEMPDAPERWRRIVALHRELSVGSEGNVYFISYRDAARTVSGMSHQEAYNITLALEPLGVITIVAKGRSGLGGKAAEFVYLLSEVPRGDR